MRKIEKYLHPTWSCVSNQRFRRSKGLSYDSVAIATGVTEWIIHVMLFSSQPKTLPKDCPDMMRAASELAYVCDLLLIPDLTNGGSDAKLDSCHHLQSMS